MQIDFRFERTNSLQMLRVRALITSMYQFGVELRLKSPISVCLTGECTPGVRNCRRAAAIGANYVRSRTKRISCCNDIVRDSFFSSRVAAEINISTVIDGFDIERNRCLISPNLFLY